MLFEKSILKTEYLPPISTFWAAANSEYLILEVCENYQKKSTRNRSKILAANGIEVLSVPLQKGKNSRMPIDKVQISYEEIWYGKHLHSFKSAYGNSPYFDYYFDPIKDIIKAKYESLLDLNKALLNFFLAALNLEAEIIESQDFIKDYPESACDLRNIKFNDPVINGYTPKKYNQVFEEKHGFVAGMSILDLLMCKGPESILYL